MAKKDKKSRPKVVPMVSALTASIVEAVTGYSMGTPIDYEKDDKGRRMKMTISQHKAQSILEGLTSMAENVYEHVTSNNVITTGGIIRSLHDAGRNTDRRKVEGCLGNLKKKGLINEPAPGVWIRVVIHAKDKTPLIATRTGEEYNVTKKPTSIVPRKPVAVEAPPETVLDKMKALKGEMMGASEILMDLETRMGVLIEECSDVLQQAEQDNAQFQQLKTLLKGISD